MPFSDSEALAGRIVGLLPPDGTPVLNRVMRAMLARALERSVGLDPYFEACSRLAEEGRIGRLRGQGGQIFLARETEAKTRGREAEPSSAEGEPLLKEAWPEARLMPALRHYLEGPFRKGLDLPAGSTCLVQDTSAIGPARGRWSRPDFILVSAMRFRLLPGSQVDVHSFELKTETGCDVLAVHECLAQTRFTHFGHLVWHLPEGAKAETKLAEIEAHCQAHGIGLIRLRDPKQPSAGDILVDPTRKPTLAATVDGFLEARLTPDRRKRLEAALGGARE